MEEPRREEPGPLRVGVLVQAVEMAREAPGEWVLARTYESADVAYVTGTRLRARYADIETNCRQGRLFVRVAD